jgi:hypothetical protein
VNEHWFISQVCQLAGELVDEIEQLHEDDVFYVELKLTSYAPVHDQGALLTTVSERIRRIKLISGEWGGTERISREAIK